jgi:hypothetical protein
VFRGFIFFSSQKMAALAMNPKHASALTKESEVDEEWKDWRMAGGTLRFSSLCNISLQILWSEMHSKLELFNNLWVLGTE